VKRFARPDLGNIIRILWSRHHAHAEARHLLLQLIWLGELQNCADLAESAFGTYPDRHTRIVAGRALTTAGDEAAKRRYAELIKDSCEALPNILVWDAIDGLFPHFLDVDDLLGIISAVDISDADGGLGFEWRSPGLVDRLDARLDLERLLNGLLDQLGEDTGGIGHSPDKREKAYFSAIAAYRLLGWCGADEAPADTIDAALELGVRRRNSHSVHEVRDISAELHRTAPRRRLAFWRAAELLNGHRMLLGRRMEYPLQMEVLGYSPKLQLEDITWLLEDAPGRGAENERRLALNTAMQLCRQADAPADLLSQIERAAHSDAAMQDAYDTWLNPPPRSAELVAQDREMNEIRQHAEAQLATRDRSWLEFIDGLRKDPNQLRRVRPMAEGVDTRLYNLWLLLSQTIDAGPTLCH
jgi:hypothetical protein